MKLRRATVVAAASAVLAPAAFLAGPGAYAAEDPAATTAPPAPTESAGPTTTLTPAPSTTPTPSTPGTALPTRSPSGTPTAGPSDPTDPGDPTDSGDPTDPGDPGDPAECADDPVEVGIEGLPGRIAAGSGWHRFVLKVTNTSDVTLEDLLYLAGASADEAGEDVFESRQVALQTYDAGDESWQPVGLDGHAVGFVGWSDELKPGATVAVPMRLNVRAGAPVGTGFSLGGSVYSEEAGDCTGFGEAAYKFRIVAAGTDTEGSEPQEGGRAPVRDATSGRPAHTPAVEVSPASRVTGDLAETGTSSTLPLLGVIGGIAVLAGAGVVFAVRRRGSGGDGEPPA